MITLTGKMPLWRTVMDEAFYNILKKISSSLEDISSNLSQMNGTLSEMSTHTEWAGFQLRDIDITLEKNLKGIDKSIFQQLETLIEVIVDK
jgi:putative methionine-R-sulfoxide reductase with GAF domain